jgi:D-3-phosphoglycerate dehydrogenase
MILNVEPARHDADARAVLEAIGPVDYIECGSRAELLATIAGKPYMALVARLGIDVDRELIAAAPALRWIVTPTTGLDHIDLSAASKRGIEVISLRGETAFLDSIRSTAEHTWALLLALVRHIPAAHADVLAGHWRRDPFLCEELAGKTLGIVGMGRLGRMVAGYGLAFGMRVTAFDASASQLERAPEGTEGVELDTLLACSECVSIHLTPATERFFDAERMARMRRDACLINTARGEIVDERALLEALSNGAIAGAAIDVISGDSRWAGEVPDSHPLVAFARTHPNLIISPHIGGYGRQSITATRRFVAEKLASRMLTLTLR